MKNPATRFFLITVGIIILGMLTWFFRSIVAYVLVAAVLSLLCRPIVDFLSTRKKGGLRLPVFLSAIIALSLLWLAVLAFILLFVPMIIDRAAFISQINPDSVLESFKGSFQWLEGLYTRLPDAEKQGLSLNEYLNAKLLSLLNLAQIGNYFGLIGKALGNTLVAAFSISFITFFFLKDEDLFFKGLMIIVPEKFEEKVVAVLNSVRDLLVRYFAGILLESSLVFVLSTLGLRIVGLSFQTAMVLGFMAGVLNIIPYIGPVISMFVGVLLGVISFASLGQTTGLLGLAAALTAVFAIAQFVDNMILQPLIYSNSVNAHPLEIFLVILAAGSVSGIMGMIIAIPVYTVLRVIAKEFFSKFEVVQKLTKNI